MALLQRLLQATRKGPFKPRDAATAAGGCETCGAAMERGQDWCLECGTAAPGRLGQRPGWRAATSVVGLTTLLLSCGVVAAYAALTSDAERTASAPPTGSGQPIVAQTPGATSAPIQPGETGPGVVAPPAPLTTTNPIIPTTNPAQNPTNTPVTPPPPAGTKTTTTPTTTTGTTTTEDPDSGTAAAANAPEDIVLKKDAAETYDPIKRAGAEFGPAKYAIDDKPDTVWDVTVPADGQPIAAGLVIDLGKPYALRSLRLVTPTDGFTLEVYGATSADELPEDVIDKRWIHLTDKKAVEDDGLILLKGKGDGAKVRLLLLHITAVKEPSDPHVAIGDVKLRGTPAS